MRFRTSWLLPALISVTLACSPSDTVPAGDDGDLDVEQYRLDASQRHDRRAMTTEAEHQLHHRRE